MSEEDQPSAIMGVTKTSRTLVDGSIVFQIEIEPRYMQAAFALFGAPGTPVAIARIKPEVAQSHARQQTVANARPVGGALARLAGQFCESEPFRQWLRKKYDPLPRTSEDAANIIRQVCGVESRALLDHTPLAAEIFHEKFRLPFNAWLTNGMK